MLQTLFMLNLSSGIVFVFILAFVPTVQYMQVEEL